MEKTATLNLSINADMMSDVGLRLALDKGLADIKNGKVENAAEFFQSFRKTHHND